MGDAVSPIRQLAESTRPPPRLCDLRPAQAAEALRAGDERRRVDALAFLQLVQQEPRGQPTSKLM